MNLALAWAEAYQQVKPGVSIAVTGGGTGTGIAALMNGTVDIANASRDMSAEEFAAARAAGIEPVEIPVAIDALAVIVHPDNPIDRLTIPSLPISSQAASPTGRRLAATTRPSFCSPARRTPARMSTSSKRSSGRVTRTTRTSSRRKPC